MSVRRKRKNGKIANSHAYASAPNQACCLVGHDAPLARVRRGKSPAAGFLSPGGRGVVVLLATTRPANPRYGKSRPVDSILGASGRNHPPAAGATVRDCLAQQLRQLGDVGGDAPGLVAGEEMHRRATA